MRLMLIINSVVALVGAVGGFYLAGASIISIANMRVPWVGALLVAALLLPITFVVSGVGAWLAEWQGMHRLAVGLIALPWCYTAGFVLAMLISFRR